MGHEKIIKLTKFILDFMYFTGILVCVTIPYTLRLVGKYFYKGITDHYIPMLFIFAGSGILAILIIGQLRTMMKTVIKEDCFVHDNVKSLERMGGYSLFISVLFIVKLCVVPSPATFVIIIVFFVAALFSGVLSYVFDVAVNYKEENDLTI